MSELLRQAQKANEKNRKNVHVALAEFSRKLALEANGIPMSVTGYQERYVALDKRRHRRWP